LEVISNSNEKSGDEIELTDTDSKSAELQSTKNELPEQEKVLIQPSNTGEIQIEEADIMAEQDQQIQESDVKPTEPDQATDEVSTADNSEVNATVSASVEENEEVPVAKEEGMTLQGEDVADEMPKEEVEKIEAVDEKHTEEEVIHYLLSLRTKESILLDSTRIK
jgi:hypothetical protein